jgi:hypothetical protein
VKRRICRGVLVVADASSLNSASPLQISRSHLILSGRFSERREKGGSTFTTFFATLRVLARVKLLIVLHDTATLNGIKVHVPAK